MKSVQQICNQFTKQLSKVVEQSEKKAKAAEAEAVSLQSQAMDKQGEAAELYQEVDKATTAIGNIKSMFGVK